MRSSKLLVGVVSGLWVLLGLGVAGCSNSPQRQANDNVTSAVDQARRSYAQALSLMAGPAYQVKGQFGAPTRPLGRNAISADDITPLAETPIDPRAMDILDAAEKALGKVLAENQQADAQHKSLAYSMLGRLVTAKGQYHELLAASTRAEIARRLTAVEDLASVARFQRQVQRMLAEMSNLGDEDLAEAGQQAAAEAAELASQAESLNDQIASSRQSISKLEEESFVLEAQAGTMMMEAAGIAGQAGLDHFDQGQERQKQAIAKRLQVLEIEAAVQNLQSQLTLTALRGDDAQARAAAAKGLIEHRGQQRGRDAQAAGEVQAQVAAASRAAEGHWRDIAAQLRTLQDAEDQVAASYQLAATRLDSALSSQPRSSDLLGAKAGVASRAGHLQLGRLELHARIAQVAAACRNAGLAEGQEAGRYLQEPNVAREAARESFDSAAQLWESAGRGVRGTGAWVFEEGAKAATAAAARLGN